MFYSTLWISRGSHSHVVRCHEHPSMDRIKNKMGSFQWCIALAASQVDHQICPEPSMTNYARWNPDLNRMPLSPKIILENRILQVRSLYSTPWHISALNRCQHHLPSEEWHRVEVQRDRSRCQSSALPSFVGAQT